MFPVKFDLKNINGSNGFFIYSPSTPSIVSVDKAGDINNDGYGDIIVGQLNPAGLGGGTSIIFGSANPFAKSVNVDRMNGYFYNRANGARNCLCSIW